MNRNIVLRNRLVMSGEALDVNFHCFANILQCFGLSFPLAVATFQRRAECMITADGFFFQNHGVVHFDTLLAAPGIVKLPPSCVFYVF